MFVARASASLPHFRPLAPENLRSVIDICRRLDGIPLALELAASRLPLLGLKVLGRISMTASTFFPAACAPG